MNPALSGGAATGPQPVPRKMNAANITTSTKKLILLFTTIVFATVFSTDMSGRSLAPATQYIPFS